LLPRPKIYKLEQLRGWKLPEKTGVPPVFGAAAGRRDRDGNSFDTGTFMKDYSLYYWDQRIEEAEVVELLNLAWDELYELEFDAVFGTWRGVHLEVETDTVHITWENMYGAPLMISIHRVTRVIRNDYPRDEFLQLEQAEIERLRNLPRGGRR
jgi:hypothetical protein